MQKGRDPGDYVSLYALLDELEALDLDESWAYYFRWLLLGPYGANLRNDVAHGFVFDPGPTYAALTLRAVSVLVLITGAIPAQGYSAGSGLEPALPRSRVELLDLVAAPIGTSSRMERIAGRVARWFERAGWHARSIQTRAALERRTAHD